MKKIARHALLAGAIGLFSLNSPVLAQTQVSALPSEVSQLLAQAQLQGRSTLRFFGMEIYEARLWADSGFALGRYGQLPFALELEYRRSLRGHLIAKRSLDEMRAQKEFASGRAVEWESQMQALFPDVKDGDRLVGLHLPGVGARFVYNGRVLGEVRDPLFARLFFGIWLSPETSEPKMRCALAACTP